MSAKNIVNLLLKNKLTPGYMQALGGMMNPKKEGFLSDGTVEPFIVQRDDEKFEVRIGFSSMGVFNSLDEAKKIKRDQAPISMDVAKKKVMEDYVKSEKQARKYVASQGKEYMNLPIKNQFVIANYMHTGHKNSDFLNAVINNDYKEAMKNYTRKGIGMANEFFKTVMFNGPINENDFGNMDQAENFANNMLDKLYPDGTIPTEAKAEQGGKADVAAEFTGGELVNNKEDEMRDAMKNGNTDKAANIFRNQVQDKNITPGKASHKSNPLPVAKDGTVMNKNGKPTGQKAKSGAGIYDHIRSQYKPSMTNEEVIAMVQKNHAKWRKNNMD